MVDNYSKFESKALYRGSRSNQRELRLTVPIGKQLVALEGNDDLEEPFLAILVGSIEELEDILFSFVY